MKLMKKVILILAVVAIGALAFHSSNSLAGPILEEGEPGGVMLRSQRIDENGIELVASDGRVFRLTAQQLFNHYQQTPGNTPQRKIDTENWLTVEIEKALGPEQVPRVIV